MKHEIETIAEIERFIAAGRDWAAAVVQGLDLRNPLLEAAMLREKLAPGAVFIGCELGPLLAAKALASGCLVFPALPGLPFHAGRGALYTADELFAGYVRTEPASYRVTPDWLCYAASMDPVTRKKRPVGVDIHLGFRLHDLSVEDATDEFLKPDPGDPATHRRPVGIMGGHDRERREKIAGGDAPYMKVALLARKLARLGFTIVTGGGPGAMEAANLGAWFAGRSEQDLREAVRMLEPVPKIAPLGGGSPFWNSGEWLGPAFDVMARFPRDASDPRTESLGVPTWFYGHEPPNVFASHIAKYFENSLREEGLLAVATAGVVFAEGNAGTVQEIFQDATQNYYQTQGPPSPMILLGSDYWTRKPAWPLLRCLAAEKRFDHLLLLTDEIDEAAEFIRRHAPTSFPSAG